MTAVAWCFLALAVGLIPAAGARGADSSTSLRCWPSTRRRSDDPALPLVLDLVAAALRSGRPLGEALELGSGAGAATTAEPLLRIARLLRLGADPRQAWRAVPARDPVSVLAPVAVRSAASGTKLAGAFERLAADLRAERAAVAAARAQRAGVFAMGPLAACFLPSFTCLGVVPTVVGVAATTLGRFL